MSASFRRLCGAIETQLIRCESSSVRGDQDGFLRAYTDLKNTHDSICSEGATLRLACIRNRDHVMALSVRQSLRNAGDLLSKAQELYVKLVTRTGDLTPACTQNALEGAL